MNESQKIIHDKILSAPAQIRGLIANGRWALTAKAISKKNNFSLEQTSAFENEVLFVLIGLELTRDFKTNIAVQVAIPEILAHDIADEVHESIFKEVIDFLPTTAEEDGVGEISQLGVSNGNQNQLSAQSMELGAIQAPTENTKFMVNGEPITGAPFAPVGISQLMGGTGELGKTDGVTVTTPTQEDQPGIPQNLPIQSIQKPPLNILEQQSFVPKTPLETKLAEQPTNTSDTVVIIDKKYSGQDPYREAV